MDLNIRIAGEAGQGVQTTGDLLVGAFASIGLYVFSTQSYLSRIRGGLNWYDVRIGDAELFSGKEKADLLVAFHPDALRALREDISERGVILFDGAGEPGVISLEFTKAAKELTGSPVMANTVAAGAVFALLGCDVDGLCRHLEKEFAKKGDESVQKNVSCARRGAEMAAPNAKTIKAPVPGDAPEFVCNGSEAAGLGAATAGVKFVASYPMTPSTGVFTFLAGVADEYGIAVEQAEDEIAAVNMICGAAYAGVPAMTTTSGGGFALMVEGLSLAGMLELPILIYLSQRPGPATGLPTRTAQQDLKFAIYAGHGEFPRAIYAPGTLEQACTLTRLALETAHRFQSPAILMSDQFLADSRKNIPPLDKSLRPIDRCIAENPSPDYVRYAVTPDGVSPRALPGSGAFVVCDSDEHTEDGHITEDLNARVRLQDKRMAKAKGILANVLPPELYGPGDAEHLLVTWGSTYGPCREAVDALNAQGASTAMLHFAQVWPIDASSVRSLIGAERRKKITSVEGNATGQFASVLREAGALAGCELLLKYDGLPFTGEEIAARIKQ